MSRLKEVEVYHVSYRNGQKFIIYKDGTCDMFSHVIKDKPDRFYPNVGLYDLTLKRLFNEKVRT